MKYRVFVSVTDDNWTIGDEIETLEEAQGVALNAFLKAGPSPSHPFSNDLWEIKSHTDDDGADYSYWAIRWTHNDEDGEYVDERSYVVEWKAEP